MIASILVANRGEIACRVIRTARAMGIRTIAVCSDADRDALHVREADTAVHIGPSPARESYLDGARILEAARLTGAEAVHPGYGFLSENADFAQAVRDAGLVWIGPAPDSIRAMGLKDAAKARMIDAGVPVTPGYLGADQSPERLAAEAEAIGWPVLIKAVAGGGGKGMRRVDNAADFADALASCRREAASSFGDDRVLLEKYILAPRHVEVQVFGDTHGNIVHLFERDCSVQRRHQKVIEEAPAPGMDDATRAAICTAAVRAARSVAYVGAGTVEFIADASEGLRADRIWFMEMNTRLQVEHPVTEEITGVDLVEWQIRVASGEPLPKRQEELAIHGHAVEARLYAEDPRNGFLPSVGRLEEFAVPSSDTGDDADFGAQRFDTGYAAGDSVSPFYDPMLGKIIAQGSDREEAIERLESTCVQTAIWPVRTNLGFIARCLRHPAFRAGNVDTGFVARHLDALAAPPLPLAEMAACAAENLVWAQDAGSGPWSSRAGFRLNAPPHAVARLVDQDGAVHCVDLTDAAPMFGAAGDGKREILSCDGERVAFTLYAPRGSTDSAGGDGALLAPMPGRVTAVDVTPGQRVEQGQRLVTLEAMKMEHGLTAPFDGIVTELPVETGAQVSEGALLVRVEPEGGEGRQ